VRVKRDFFLIPDGETYEELNEPFEFSHVVVVLEVQSEQAVEMMSASRIAIHTGAFYRNTRYNQSPLGVELKEMGYSFNWYGRDGPAFAWW